jgi:hypothetical protein
LFACEDEEANVVAWDADVELVVVVVVVVADADGVVDGTSPTAISGVCTGVGSPRYCCWTAPVSAVCTKVDAVTTPQTAQASAMGSRIRRTATA